MRKVFSATLLILLLSNGIAWAVKTSHWIHTTETDFKDGTFEHVVTTNLGDLKLSRQVKTLLKEDPRISAVFAMAQAPDGTIYAGTGPEGILLAVKDDKTSTAAELGTHTNIFSLLVDSGGRLLAGTGGEKGEVLRINQSGQKPQSIFSADDVQYVWAMTQTPDGIIYAATGPSGKLIQINADGTNKVLLDSEENNLLCLASDGKDFLYVGTDPNGLVYRVNRKTGEMFVLYDAAESEISSLLLDGRGNLYAATGDATGDAAENNDEGAAEQTGRPEAERRGLPIPSQPPATPKPPEVPNPAPGEPLPIPRQTAMLMILAPGNEPGMPAPGPASRPSAAKTTRKPPMPEIEKSDKNAIYRIDPGGFVTEIFRQPVSVFAMIEQAGTLLVATGNEGNLYQVNPEAEETLVLAKVDPKDVLCLLPAKDGRIFMGLANSGEIAAMTPGFATEGTYVSAVLDAGQISRFGKIQLRGSLPASTSLKISTRSGNVEESSDPGWSKWSDDIPAVEFVQATSPAARFLQYRLTFTTSEAGQATPVVEEINVAYQVPNQPPQIKSITLEQPQATGEKDEDQKNAHQGSGKLTINWIATDPNEDELGYAIYFRNSTRGPWILMKDKVKDPTFDWETRNVGGGRYEIKVEASDAAANPVGMGKTSSRVSDLIVVDNTAPVIGDIKTTVNGDEMKISLNVADRTSTVDGLQYSVDASDNWQTVLPSDTIADSPQEAYEFTVSKLSAGAHQITLRAMDARGNRAFESVTASVNAAAR